MMSPVVGMVANGRRLAARHLVMNAPGTIACQVWRKRVILNDPATSTQTGLSWDVVKLSDQDEPEYDYDEVGHAYLLIDQFVGGAVFENNTMVDGGEAAVSAQIEPYLDSIENKRDQVMSIPDWLPKEGDVFALLIHENLILWMEVVTITGSSLVADFGKRYILNKRDMPDMPLFNDELENRV